VRNNTQWPHITLFEAKCVLVRNRFEPVFLLFMDTTPLNSWSFLFISDVAVVMIGGLLVK
jgi:hypothetical protein